MLSWWARKFQIVAQEDKYKQHEEKQKCRNHGTKSNASKTRTRTNKRKQNIAKAKSFEETVLFSDRISSASPNASSIPGNGPSIYEIFHSEKQAYPLPRPSRSLDLPSVKFDQEVMVFTSQLASSSTSPSSGSSTSASLGFDITGDYRDFGSSTEFEESECEHDLTIQHFGTEKLILLPQLWETSTDSQTIKDENWNHLCHPLSLPPYYSNGLSQHLQSKWIKGRLLGRGSFGHVYVGFNSTNGQLCAIKEIRSICEDQNSEGFLKGINQEAAVLSRLSHHNIVQYYGSELGKGRLSLYLEYVSGGSIHKLLQEYGPFKEPLIRTYTRQILHALAYLHARNIVHRDIKGSNILVDPNGKIKLADFGMAKHITSCSSVLSFKGSPRWLAPEVILISSCVGLHVDTWSLGCTIIEMATSKPPWSKYEGVAAIFKIANSKDYPQIPSQLSENAQTFLKLCLQRDPLLRPSAAQLLHHPFVHQLHSCCITLLSKKVVDT